MVVAKNSNAQITHRQLPIRPASAAPAPAATSAFASSEAEPAATASIPVVSVRDATYLPFPNLLTFKRSNVPTFQRLFQAGFQPRAPLIETRLDIYNTILPVFDFTLGRHHPDKVNLMTRNRDIGMKPVRHQHRVGVADDTGKFGLIRIRVDKLNHKCRCRHVVINVQLLQHCGVLMRWPARPVAGRRSSEPRKNAAGFNVLAEQDVDSPGV